jgi:hypothetical protein
MISASMLPPSLRSTVIDSLAQVAWSSLYYQRILVSISGTKNGPLMGDYER